MRNNKKASLNLSIQAIVIIVIAFTVLGLGLTFVRTQLTAAGETTTEVQQQIKGQILDDLRRGDNKLSFPTNEVKVNKGDPKELVIGVKNMDEQDLKFKVQMHLINNDGSASVVLNKQNVKDEENFNIGKFIWSPAPQKLSPTDANVFPIKFIASNHADSYNFEVVIVEEGTGDVYASKPFLITII